MKKLIIAAAVVCMAVVSQAASVSWTSGTFTGGFKGPDDKTMKGLTTFTMTVSLYTDSGATSTPVVSSSSTPNGGGAYMGTFSDVAADTDYWVKAIISGKDSNGKDWTREAALSAIHTPAQGTPILSFMDGSNFVVTGQKWGAWTSAAPEPTSGLMLLLGVGLMALKRKRV